MTKLWAEGVFEVLIFGSLAFWQIFQLVRAIRTGRIDASHWFYGTGDWVTNDANPRRYERVILARSALIALNVGIVAYVIWHGPLFVLGK